MKIFGLNITREAKVIDSGHLISTSKHAAAEYLRAFCQAHPQSAQIVAAELATGKSAEQVAKSVRKVSGFVA